MRKCVTIPYCYIDLKHKHCIQDQRKDINLNSTKKSQHFIQNQLGLHHTIFTRAFVSFTKLTSLEKTSKLYFDSNKGQQKFVLPVCARSNGNLLLEYF